MLGYARLLILGCSLVVFTDIQASDEPLPIVNTKSGIAVTFSGDNGRDWAVEQTCHDPLLSEIVVHLKPGTKITLAHNENNVAMHDERGFQRLLGVNGHDGKANSGDEGEIRFKFDRDGQAHAYVRPVGMDLPAWCRLYAQPFSLAELTHEDGKPILGSMGDNGKSYGDRPNTTTERFMYGVTDSSGNEWHTLTYWDDDSTWLNAAKIKHDKRTDASDGHWIALCVAPRTPLVQIRAPAGEQFYTTPIKTYHVPKIWEQTTYLTGSALVGFANLANDQAVRFRIGQGAWQNYAGTALVARDLFPEADRPIVVELQCGEASPILRRMFVRDPKHPSLGEQHGLLLWPDAAGLQAARERLHGAEPFKTSYAAFRGDYYQGMPWVRSAARPGWRGGATMCSSALNNALVMAVEGADKAAAAAALAKERLLFATRPEPIGQEITCDASSPSTDFLQVLGQTTQAYADAGVAYDLVAAFFRSDQQPGGLTAIEDYLLRDNLAKCAKTLLQFRDIYNATSGSGDTHWSHGWEMATGMIALAMPTYARPCFGVSGADQRTLNDLKSADGTFWNPYPNQGVTWWQAVTDPALSTPGYPNAVLPFRAEFLLTDDGWWTGPNNLQTEGDRYFNNALTDIKYGGLRRCNGVVELTELQGYENPFITRLMAWEHMRRLRGDGKTVPCIAAYIRRFLIQGPVALTWDKTLMQYHLQARHQFVWALPAFNHLQPTMALPIARVGVTRWLGELTAYFADPKSLDPAIRAAMDNERKALFDPYALALCELPTSLPAAVPPIGAATLPPVIRPLFKHVIRPGQALHKDLQVFSPDGRDVTVEVKDLPEGASYDAVKRIIAWTPKPEQVGVYVLSVTVNNGLSANRPFLVVVYADPLKLPAQVAPGKLEATLTDNNTIVHLTWEAAAGARTYLIYRDGACWAAVPGETTDYSDRSLIAPGQNTRYHVAAIGAAGSESAASEVLIRIPPITPSK
ncbi:MAG: Ig domain-containing protein [Planctomycetota bacterium]